MTAGLRGGVLAALAALALAGPALGDNCASGELFVNASAYPTADQPFEAVSADFNGDGRPDVATLGGGYQSTRISVLLANADGSFAAPIDGPEVEYATGAVCP